MKKHLIILSLLLAPCSLLHAASVKLTRAEASELYVALAQTEAGLSPANTVAAADNILALRPVVEALDKGKQAAVRQIKKIPGVSVDPRSGAWLYATPETEAAAQVVFNDLEAKSSETIAVDLVPVALSEDEITAAKIRPASLAVIRRWLLKLKS